MFACARLSPDDGEQADRCGTSVSSSGSGRGGAAITGERAAN
jgi:hypothetical protein